MKIDSLKKWCESNKKDFTLLEARKAFIEDFNKILRELLDEKGERGYAMFNLTESKSTICLWIKDKSTNGTNHFCYHIYF